jgi:hypothetical protein
MIQTRERLVRLAVVEMNFQFPVVSGIPRYVKRWKNSGIRNNYKGGKSLFTVKLCRLLCVTLRPNTSACLGVSPSRSAPWASPSIDVGFGNLRFEVSR